jgi:hypothetical protein
MNQTLNLKIADFKICLNAKFEFEAEVGYKPFIIEDQCQTADVFIDCVLGIPAIKFEDEPLLFEAKNEQQRFYSIFKLGTDLGFIIYSQQYPNVVKQVAFLDQTLSHWTVFSDPIYCSNSWPLSYPFGPLMMLYLTVKTNTVMMHASCVFDGERGRVFTGFSGNGKSTISKLWADAGSIVINDDRLIIRKYNDGFYAHNTPMYYEDAPKKTVLDAIYLISHSPCNGIRKLTGALSVSKVLAFCIQNNFDQKLIQNRLLFITELCNSIPVFDLGFVPDGSVVNFIAENDTIGDY